MAKVNLTNMDVQSLLNLRKQVDEALAVRRVDLQKQLAKLTDNEIPIRRRGVSKLRGSKVPAKYRGPRGETWAGRGAQPRWLAEAIKAGQSPEDFLIKKIPAVAKKKRKRRAKR
jgi:DNA-binding protein H-NS